MATGPYLLVCHEVSLETGNCTNQSWVLIDADLLVEKSFISLEDMNALTGGIISICVVLFIILQIKKVIEL